MKQRNRAIGVILWSALILGATASTASARIIDISCTLSDGATHRAVTFAIDTQQFAPPVNPGEPPRQQRTQVTMNDARFQAEPLLLPGARRGFWAVRVDGSEILLVIEPAGTAELSDSRHPALFVGQCSMTRS